MIIVHIITAFGIGGAEKLLLNIINEQVKTHEVHLVYLKPINDLIHLLDKKVEIKNIPLSLFTITNLKKYFKAKKPDIVHTHLSHADILGSIANTSSKAKVFATIHSTKFKKTLLDNFIFFIYAIVFNLKKVNVISISKSVENVVFRKIHVKQNKSFLLYNALPPAKTHPQQIMTQQNKIRLLFVGRLEKAKSLETLLLAINHIQKQRQTIDFKLTIVGEGSLRKNLEDLSKELKIQHVVDFVGAHQKTQVFYASADIFILPSIWEGFGIVILEAFRAKLPVIASNIEGPSELIRDNFNGLLFEKGNAIELASKITELVNDKNRREILAENGYKSFTEKYHIKNYVKKLNILYQDA